MSRQKLLFPEDKRRLFSTGLWTIATGVLLVVPGDAWFKWAVLGIWSAMIVLRVWLRLAQAKICRDEGIDLRDFLILWHEKRAREVVLNEKAFHEKVERERFIQ